MTLRETDPGTSEVAVGVTHADAAAVYGGSTSDLVLITYDEWSAGADLSDARAVRLAAYADMGPAVSLVCGRLVAGQDLEVSVEQGVGAARAALEEELARHPAVRVTAARRVGERVVLQLGTGVAAETAQRRLLLDQLGGSTAPAPRRTPAPGAAPSSGTPSGTAPGTHQPAPPPSAGPDRSPTAVAARLLRRASRVTGATTRRGRLLTLAGIAGILAIVLLLGLVAIGTSSLGSSGVVVTLLLVVLAAQALVGLVVLVQTRAVRTQQQDLHGVRTMLERRTDRLLAQGRKAAKGQRDLKALRRRVDGLHQSGLRERALSARRFDTLERVQTRQHLDTQRQVQAILNLEHLVTVSGRVPPMGGWAASADLMVLILDELLALRPRTVVECGSGTSTLLLALAAQQHGLDTRIVALEHLERFGEQTEATLARHGVADRAEVRIAPLTVGTVKGHSTPWYDESALDDLHDIGMLVIDGPPTATGDLARYPAIPLLRDRLAPEAVIIMDDLVRDSDQRVADLWRELLPDFSYEVVDTLQKRAGVFRRTPHTVARS